MGVTIFEIPTPALLVEASRLNANISAMAQRTAALGVGLRPHVKTHKCVEIADRQRSLGAAGITVSTLYEARIFAERGFNDITWAYPVVMSRVEEARALVDRVALTVVVDSVEAVRTLERTGLPFQVLLKVDSGYHRAGVDPASTAALDVPRAIAASRKLVFRGLLSHSGHTYHMRAEQIASAVECERLLMLDFAERLASDGIKVRVLSVGSTPAMAFAERLDGISETRPGNYVFYDYTQVCIGSCATANCALSVLSSVVSTRGGIAILDAGSLAVSRDPGSEFASEPALGRIYENYERAIVHPDVRITALSQEHGWINAPLSIGSKVRVLPNHACLTAACFDEYTVVDGDRVVDRWKIFRGRN